jgi:two-component system, sensor histidine kinase RegB
MDKQPIPTAMHLNLQRLLKIRVIVFVCQVLALLYAWQVLTLELPYLAITSIFMVLALFNGALYLRLRKHRSPSEKEFFLHLLVDVAGLSLLLYLSGGANNPFVSYFLVPVTIAAATLAWTWTGLLALLALACYSVLLFYHQPLELLMPLEPDMQGHVHEPVTAASSPLNLHIIGMWFNFLVSAALITWFVAKMAAEIRRQQDRLSRYREDTLRNEQILAVATQAAGTAHELGTPLGTMTVLLKDLQLDHQQNPALLTDLHTLQQQVEHCRMALQQLTRNADYRNLQRETLPLEHFMHQLLDQWQLLRPELPCEYRQLEGNAPMVEVDLTLRQALINILNNAADASPEGITIETGWNVQEWFLRVRDFGLGISRELQEQLGISIVSTKESGLGVGLVLSQATINRFGGSVKLYSLDASKGGGTLTEILLPL